MQISETFGEAVKGKINDRGWSYQRACVATGIPGATIGRMAMGIVPGADHVIKWAVAIKEDVNFWLMLAGYDPIPVELMRADHQWIERDGERFCIPADKELSEDDIQEVVRILKYGSVSQEERRA